MMGIDTCCILFVKEPKPGTVKTRLTTHITAEEAAELYRAFVIDSVDLVRKSNADMRVIAHTPAECAETISSMVPNLADFLLWPQRGKNLGDRMTTALLRSFEQGCERTVIIGSDTPSLPPHCIDVALSRLEETEVVIGRSVDGGYYVVGQRAGEVRLFERIQWSTGRVLEQSLECLGDISMSVLHPWYDVDTVEEAAFLKVHLTALARAGSGTAPNTSAVLAKLDLPPPS